MLWEAGGALGMGVAAKKLPGEERHAGRGKEKRGRGSCGWRRCGLKDRRWRYVQDPRCRPQPRPEEWRRKGKTEGRREGKREGRREGRRERTGGGDR